MAYWETVLGDRSDPQCFVRGPHGLVTPSFIPNKGKTLLQLSRQKVYWKFLEGMFTYRLYGQLEEYLCNQQCFVSGSHNMPTSHFLPNMGKLCT